VRGLPAGLGEPVFDRLEADLAKAMLSLPATKGFELGSGFAGATLRGSEHNDAFEVRDGRVRTRWSFVPSASLGGDSFGYHWLDDDRLAIYLLDVCGHGVGPALLSVSVMNALHVNALYLRLREIQSPAFQRPDDAAFVRLAAELRHAPDEHALARGIYQVVFPALIKALSDHETATFPNSDLPSVYAIKHALLDLRAQQERMLPLLAAVEAEGAASPATTAWERYIQALLDASGGVSGTGPRAAARAACQTCRAETSPQRRCGDRPEDPSIPGWLRWAS
jgi:hypothetical protein